MFDRKFFMKKIIHEKIIHEKIIHEKIIHEKVIHKKIIHEQIIHEISSHHGMIFASEEKKRPILARFLLLATMDTSTEKGKNSLYCCICKK
jgi:hypothetical protein